MFDNLCTWFSEHELQLTRGMNKVDKRILRLQPKPKYFDFCVSRPFIKWENQQLLEFTQGALHRDWPALELASLAYLEAEKRTRGNIFPKVSSEFDKAGIQPIRWLNKARDAIRGVSSSFERPSAGMASVYYILLGGYSKQSGFYGCYVGQTASTNLEGYADRVTKRAAQHFTGIHAGRGLAERGVEPLWSLNCFTESLKAKDIKSKETACSLALNSVSIKTKGDIQEG